MKIAPILKFGLPALFVLGALWLAGRNLRMEVLVEPAVEGTAVNAVTGTVEVLANMDIRVKAMRHGQLVRNVVAAGQPVEEGDLVGLQDSTELDLQIEHVRIRLEAAEDRAGLESINKIDVETLDAEIEGLQLAVELRQAPASRLENAVRERRKKEIWWKLDEIQVRENVKVLRNQLEQMLLQKDQLSTRAPFSGTIVEINAFTGDQVNPGQNLVRLVSNGRYVLMELTEEDYFGVEDGQAVTLRLAGYPDRTFAGVVQRLAGVADSNTKTRTVFVNVDAPDEVLVPGMTGEGFLVKDQRTGAVLVPRRALVGSFVYVVEDGRIEQRRVKTGYIGLLQAEILEGVEAGDLVVVEDQNLLKPGDRVRTDTGR